MCTSRTTLGQRLQASSLTLVKPVCESLQGTDRLASEALTIIQTRLRVRKKADVRASAKPIDSAEFLGKP
jgi:hypothetical protein